MGTVVFVYETTTNLVDNYDQLPDAAVIVIPNNVMESYALSVIDILSYIEIDETLIDTVRLRYSTYSSTNPYPAVTAELWVDNVCVDVDGSCDAESVADTDDSDGGGGGAINIIFLLLIGIYAKQQMANRKKRIS